MTINNDLKSRLAAELAGVLYGDGEVPDESWGFIDGVIDEHFGDWERRRFEKLLQDLEALRCNISDPTPSDIWGASGSSQRTDKDWMILRGVVDQCARELLDILETNCDRDESYGLIFEAVSDAR